MRDVTDIGHHGNGNLEYSLAAGGQLDEARALIARAYAGAG
jgi:predicted transport protein